MSILVIAEHDNASINGATLNTVTAAKAIGGDITVLVAGEGCAAAGEAAAKIDGVSKVLVADNAAYGHQLAENVSLLVAELGKDYGYILAPATTNGKNTLPRAAALLDVAQISEIISVESGDTFKRPIYAGNVIATVQSSDPIKVITVRATAFDAAAAEGGSAAVEAVGSAHDAGNSSYVKEELAKSDRPDLTAVVCRMATTSACCTLWLTSLALRLVHHVQRSTRASFPTTCRWVRLVRLLLRGCTSLWAFPVRSSIWPV